MARVATLFALSALAGLAAGRDVEVTCGSTLKLQHVKTGYQLHSHQVRWGAGSGQQSVTANGAADDQGELFIVKEPHNGLPCEAGTVVKCGGIVRLEHMFTQKNLHTHRFVSPLLRLQEVSAFGEEGDGDSGDNWVVECVDPSSGSWLKDGKIMLRSVDTKKYLYSTADARFTQANCPHCPIIGQQEVACHTDRGENAQWAATQGLFLSSNA